VDEKQVVLPLPRLKTQVANLDARRKNHHQKTTPLRAEKRASF
jgi:hypothetical protein